MFTVYTKFLETFCDRYAPSADPDQSARMDLHWAQMPGGWFSCCSVHREDDFQLGKCLGVVSEN